MTKFNHLNDAKARNTKLMPGYYIDGRGLYLQVAEKGGRSWIFRYKLHGRDREMGLGSILDLGVAAARDAAQEMRMLVKQGIDPIDRRRAAKAAQLAATVAVKVQEVQTHTTFEMCATQYIEQQADEWRNAKHRAQWTNTLKTYVYEQFGSLPVRDIGKAQIIDALRPIWKDKAETASRVLQRVRTVMNFAAAHDYCSGLDVEFWNQVRLALGSNDRARKTEHHASCPYKDAPALLAQVVGGSATPMVKLAFEFTVLTAARSGEVRGALWSEIDEQEAQWVIPGERMKSGREHRVPLTPRVLMILMHARQCALEINGTMSALVFPNQKGKAFSDMVFTQLLRRLGVLYTVHGFRATFRTWGMETTDYPHEMLEFALAHVSGDATVRAYARGDMVTRRRSLMRDWQYFLST